MPQRIPALLATTILLATARAPAQQSPTWTAEEAGIPVVLRAVAAAGKELPVDSAPSMAAVVSRARVPRFPRLAKGSGGDATLGGYTFRLHNARSGATAPGFVVYAWPTNPAAGLRAFVVGAAGTVLSTDGVKASYGSTPPAWNAAVARGAEDSLAHLLTALGEGRDGRLWHPVAGSASVQVQVRLRDAAPGAAGGVQVVVGPECWFPDGAATPIGGAPVPADLGPLGANGTAQLSGCPATGLFLGLLADGELTPGVRVQRVADGVEVAFDSGRLVAARCTAEERAVIATLRNISSAQAQCQATGAIDVDGDGVGEHAFFAELAGRVALRGTNGTGGEKLNPPVLPSAYGQVRQGRMVRKGYVFQMFLPGKAGTWLAEADAGGAAGVAVDPAAAGKRWRCYAWPVTPGPSGRRAFVVDEAGDVAGTENGDGRYQGDGKPIAPLAAYASAAADAPLAVNGKAQDGGSWLQVH